MDRPFLRSDRRPLPIAHRGGAKRFPENTLLAFGRAAALGFTHIETDIQLTRDREIVVLHDLSLERTTDGRGLTRDHDLAELRALDAAHRYTRDGRSFPYRGRGERIPTLEEALTAFPEIRFNLELKGLDPELPVRVHEFIEAHGVHERVLVASAHDIQVERFRQRMGARVATSAGADQILRFWLGVKTGLGRYDRYPFDALQVPHYHGRLRVVDHRFVEAAHARGIHVHVWTIDDPAEMAELAGLGVDAIMSDRPERLMQVLATAGRALEA